MYLQSTMANHWPDKIQSDILWWLDDILIHSVKLDYHLFTIQRFFAFCEAHNDKLHPAKCTLFTISVRWCGRLIGKDGIRFDPERVDEHSQHGSF